MNDETLTDIDDIYASVLAQLEKEKAELLEALKKIRGVEVWILDREMKELFQKIVYTAIENAENK